VPKIYWYGPKYGDGSTGDRVSHTYRVAGALRLKAMEIAHVAAFLLDSRAQHRTGDSQIKVKHYPTTHLDSIVYLEDPWDKGETHGAAAGIEKTHHVLRDAVDSV
jgi:hypothetical protein